MAECFVNDTADCPLIDSCGLNAALREALGAFFAVLERHTIADLVAARPNMREALGIDDLAPRNVSPRKVAAQHNVPAA
jgi:Rrf2 family iron-responsive transcriptional regulator